MERLELLEVKNNLLIGSSTVTIISALIIIVWLTMKKKINQEENKTEIETISSEQVEKVTDAKSKPVKKNSSIYDLHTF